MVKKEADQLEQAVADFLTAFFMQQELNSVRGCEIAVDTLVRKLKEYRESKEAACTEY